MRYVPRKPREGINVSDEHPLVEAGTLIVGLTAIFLMIALVLIFLIEIALYFVPVEKEAQLFSDWLPFDLVTISPVDDRLYETELLLDRLLVHWPEGPYQFRVEIHDSEAVNAMALPGGLIVVTQGLLNAVESENELAFVLGHELGHFSNRDHLRALGRGIVFSLFFAAITGNDVAGLGISVSDLTLRGFSRQQESRADEFGLAAVYAEYGHVGEAWRLFERWNAEAGAPGVVSEYLATHPAPGDRVARLGRFAEQRGWSREGPVSPLGW